MIKATVSFDTATRLAHTKDYSSSTDVRIVKLG